LRQLSVALKDRDERWARRLWWRLRRWAPAWCQQCGKPTWDPVTFQVRQLPKIPCYVYCQDCLPPPWTEASILARIALWQPPRP